MIMTRTGKGNKGQNIFRALLHHVTCMALVSIAQKSFYELLYIKIKLKFVKIFDIKTQFLLIFASFGAATNICNILILQFMLGILTLLGLRAFSVNLETFSL